MTSTVNNRFEYGVGTTTKRVTHTLLNLWKREYNTVECQTISFEEFQAQFIDKIRELEQNLKSKTEERKIIEQDITRLRKQMEFLSL